MATLTQKLKNGLSAIKKGAYTNLYYTIGYSTVVGVGNAFGSVGSGEALSSFNEGFWNNVPLALAVNSTYPLTFPWLEMRENFRAYAHTINLSLNSCFVVWHYAMGTENPLSASVPAIAAGVVLTELWVRGVESKKQTNGSVGLEAKIS